MHLIPLPNPDHEAAMSNVTYTVEAAFRIIRTDDKTPDEQKGKMTAALRKLCQATGMPADALVLTPGVLRDNPLAQAAAVHRVSARSMRGTRSGLRAVLRYLNIIDPPYPPPTPPWQALLDRIDPKQRGGLTQFAHYCPMTGVEPEIG